MDCLSFILDTDLGIVDTTVYKTQPTFVIFWGSKTTTTTKKQPEYNERWMVQFGKNSRTHKKGIITRQRNSKKASQRRAALS